MNRYFGAHVSVSGGLEKAVENARFLGVNSIQIHPSPPQRWNRSPYKEGHETSFLALKGDYPELKKVYFHAIYLINLATPDLDKLQLAEDSLVNYMDLNSRLNGDGVVVHVGSLKDEPDHHQGLTRAANTIKKILEKSPPKSKLILEVAAGSGQVIGANFKQLRDIYDLVGDNTRLGFGLDTQHMWASGYDLSSKQDEVVKEIEQQFGWDKVWIIHLNDSKTPLASKTDRHENLGQGLIGEDALRRFLARSELKDIPIILETPALKSLETAKPEVDILRIWLEEASALV